MIAELTKDTHKPQQAPRDINPPHSIGYNLDLHDIRPDTDTLESEILAGLQQPIKQLPTKLLYDERGSQLFDEITELDEYYPTRTETSIMQCYIHEMAARIGSNAILVEYGSGSSLKTRVLLDHLSDLAAYIPIDISAEHLANAATKLRFIYPQLEILPISADYMHDIELPQSTMSVARRIIYFPGSTIGNFQRDEVLAFLQRVARICGPDGGLLIGVDLKKDPVVLHQAYNDKQAVTAAFNLNILMHINRQFKTDFQIDQFRHYAYYNAPQGRIEMHLVNLAKQDIRLNGQSITVQKGESIWTESSYKYTVEEFNALAATAGLRVVQVWTDPEQLFSVQYLETM